MSHKNGLKNSTLYGNTVPKINNEWFVRNEYYKGEVTASTPPLARITANKGAANIDLKL